MYSTFADVASIHELMNSISRHKGRKQSAPTSPVFSFHHLEWDVPLPKKDVPDSNPDSDDEINGISVRI